MEILKTTNISIILLAAGQSSRMGSPKQLLLYKGKTLIQNSIDLTEKIGLNTVAVVGAYSEQIIGQTDFKHVKIEVNAVWHEGMSSSLQCGLSYLLRSNPDTEAIIVILCDQPLLTSQVIINIVRKYQETFSPIVHCNYGETTGPPTLFHKSTFSYIMELTGDQGGKNVINLFSEKVVYVDFQGGEFDIDTTENFNHLLNMDDGSVF